PPLSGSFRTLGSGLFDEIPPGIRLLVRKARTFQIGLEELYEGRNPANRLITRDLDFKPSTPVEDIAAAVRDHLGITLEEQTGWPDNDGCDTALQKWR
ncbi:MAG: ImmA/IrrE family metallo-endopeptidase, partial [Hyphomonadaceae bacterium]|nr:ImmA/IrrE family metallo-endopeptidase [Hyphomonadaceae bacterium]